jgi:HPr kinase/phosphorylase
VPPTPNPPPGRSEQIHGALVEVRGTGVLILGESGLGKSETALELITRGHRLAADDVVRIEAVPDGPLVGRAPELIRHHLEVRGIGIVDVRGLYGDAAVCEHCTVDLVCRIVPWERDRVFERVGLERPEEEVMGRKLPAVVLPARPSGNLATLVDLAVRDHRDREHGGSAARAGPGGGEGARMTRGETGATARRAA